MTGAAKDTMTQAHPDTKPMRIAFFCPTVSGIGGVETATRNLMTGFDELGDQTRLFLFGGSYDLGWVSDLDYTAIGTPRDHRLVRMAKYALGAIQAVAGWRPDAIICSDATTIEMARLGRAVSRLRVPIASWIHFPLNIIRMKEKLPLADLHLAISDEGADDLRAFMPTQRERVYTIYNAIDTRAAFPIPRPKIASFLYVGRLTFDGQKRVNDLLQAVARLKGEWRLKLIGAPAKNHEEDGERLHQLAAELGITHRLEWLGWQKNAWAVAGETTALVMPSAHEGFGMVLVEAAAHGIVCVSSDCKSGPAEIIRPGENGWLYPVANVDKLTEHLQRLVDDPESLPPYQTVHATAMRYAAPAIAARARSGLLQVI